MASSGGSSGVKNIMAMFEAKKEQSTSPPSRGRSPAAGSDINSIRSTSSRPVSKIRTSFVAVENKSGQLGLRRISDVQQEKAGMMEGDSVTRPLISRTASNAGELAITEEEPEKESIDMKGETKKGGSLKENEFMKENGITTTKGRVQEVKKQVHKSPAPDGAQAGRAPTNSKLNSSTAEISSKEGPGRNKMDSKTTTSTASMKTSGPAATSTAKPKSAVTSKPSIKTDGLPKVVASRTSTPRTSLASSAAKDAKFVKTRPKSPTKPARLPPGATAPTAASAAKIAADKSASSTTAKPRASTDGDFLARMMRPTAASASKVHDKSTPVTTPQKTAAPKPKRASDVASKINPAAQKTIVASAPVLKTQEKAPVAQKTPTVSKDSDKAKVVDTKHVANVAKKQDKNKIDSVGSSIKSGIAPADEKANTSIADLNESKAATRSTKVPEESVNATEETQPDVAVKANESTTQDAAAKAIAVDAAETPVESGESLDATQDDVKTISAPEKVAKSAAVPVPENVSEPEAAKPEPSAEEKPSQSLAEAKSEVEEEFSITRLLSLPVQAAAQGA